jgi:hypothetical protein
MDLRSHRIVEAADTERTLHYFSYADVVLQAASLVAFHILSIKEAARGGDPANGSQVGVEKSSC